MKLQIGVLMLLAVAVAQGEVKVYKARTLAGEVFAAAKPVETDHSPQAMMEAAQAFLASLAEDERKLVLLPITDPERRKWTNVPTKATDGGLRLGDLEKEQLDVIPG